MQLYNTLTKTKEPLQPRDGDSLRMYVCGITAYDLCHIGHARSAVVFDVMVRYLRATGRKVIFARNFTDVDDKIIKRAAEKGVTETELSLMFIAAFHEDMDKLGVVRADLEPKCTEYIQEMIDLTVDLIDKGNAYATASGDVYFSVRSYPDYGKLSGRNVDEMRAGARIEPGSEKEDPLDFALWKSAKPGEPTWDSPWGLGRPGWHLECSAMAEKLLGIPLDVHGGGLDLIFPHHENEIAQSEAATGTPLADIWAHNGFVQVDAEKMSKSLGNFKTIRDILESYLPETLRWFLLTKHYRSPIDFTEEAMIEAEKNLKRIYETKRLVTEELKKTKWSGAKLPDEIPAELDELEKAFSAAMEDDLNTAAALGHLFGVIRLAGRLLEDKTMRKSAQAKELFERILQGLDGWSEMLGVAGSEPTAFLAELRDKKAERHGVDAAKVDALLAERAEARKNKDFAKSDAVRDELAAMHVEVKDTPQGQVWDVM